MLTKIASAYAWQKAKKRGAIPDRREVVKNYVVYKFEPEVYINDPGNILPGERGEILPGDKLYKMPVTVELV
jgi:hypothetical protein